jgi:hypothetical protein
MYLIGHAKSEIGDPNSQPNSRFSFAQKTHLPLWVEKYPRETLFSQHTTIGKKVYLPNQLHRLNKLVKIIKRHSDITASVLISNFYYLKLYHILLLWTRMTKTLNIVMGGQAKQNPTIILVEDTYFY